MILIALGSNLASSAGSPAQTLRAALAMLESRGARPMTISSFYETPAWPDPSDPAFVNAVARIETAHAPAALLALLHEVETELGRRRSVPNAPRSLDLDLLDYEGRTEAGPPVLPHPRMESRGFVMVPLAEIAPGWRHPVSGRSAAAIAEGLEKQGIKRLDGLA